jgi:hypothetical protein
VVGQFVLNNHILSQLPVYDESQCGSAELQERKNKSSHRKSVNNLEDFMGLWLLENITLEQGLTCAENEAASGSHYSPESFIKTMNGTMTTQIYSVLFQSIFMNLEGCAQINRNNTALTSFIGRPCNSTSPTKSGEMSSPLGDIQWRYVDENEAPTIGIASQSLPPCSLH